MRPCRALPAVGRHSPRRIEASRLGTSRSAARINAQACSTPGAADQDVSLRARGEIDGRVAESRGDDQTEVRQQLQQCRVDTRTFALHDEDVAAGQELGQRHRVSDVLLQRPHLRATDRLPVGGVERHPLDIVEHADLQGRHLATNMGLHLLLSPKLKRTVEEGPRMLGSRR